MNAISGLVPIAAYMSDPTASRYGTFFILAISSILLGDWDFDSGAEGSIGMDEGFKSSKLNLVIIASMYVCCDSIKTRKVGATK